MSTSPFNQKLRCSHLRRLDRVLNRTGNLGTALVDPDEDLDDTWTGLLVWNIADGAQAGIVIRASQEAHTGNWQYRHDNGTVIAGVDEWLKVTQELTDLLTTGRARVLR